jgi:phosphate transport system substrate-binding protein
MRIRLVLILCLLSLVSTNGLAKETLTIAGAGPSTKIVALFFQNFAKQPPAQNYDFVVPSESVKHAGGIKHSFKNLFGRTGRPLNAQELNFKREQIFLARMPIAFATGRGVNVSHLSMRELEMIFHKNITNWKKVGGPDAEIVAVGRERGEALFTELKRDYTFFKRSRFDKTYIKDHEVVKFLESPQGRYAIAFGAKSNLDHLNEVVIEEDLSAGVRLGLVYDKKHKKHPLVIAVKEYAQSEEWEAIVRSSPAQPVKHHLDY